MFKALMAVQWKRTKGAAFLMTVLGFVIPIASVEAVVWTGDSRFTYTASGVVVAMQSFGVWYAFLAAGTGLAFAVLAWSQDNVGRHVYALSLPLPRSKYAAMRFEAGALFLLLPTFGVLVGCVVASMIAPIPVGMHAYPVAMTLRFLLAAGVAFAIFFAISAATPKAAGMVLGGIAAVVLVGFMLSLAAVRLEFLGSTINLLFASPGILSIFTGRWMLIDV
jgi:hypothetical protein